TFGSRSGTFATITGSGSTWTPQYNSGDFTMQVFAEVEAEGRDEGQQGGEERRPADEEPRAVAYPGWWVVVEVPAPFPADEELPPEAARDAVFEGLPNGGPAGSDATLTALEELLTLPLAVVEALVALV